MDQSVKTLIESNTILNAGAVILFIMLKEGIPFLFRKLTGKNGTATLYGHITHVGERVNAVHERMASQEAKTDSIQQKLDRQIARCDEIQRTKERVSTVETLLEKFIEGKDLK